MQTLTIIFVNLVVLAIVVVFYRSYIEGEKRIMEYVRTYYMEQGLQVLVVSPIPLKERIKYGIPLSPFFKYMYSQVSFFGRSDICYFRTVETSDASGNEHLRYVALQPEDGFGFPVKEFDVYDY